MKFFSSKIAITLNVVAALVLLLNGGGGSGGGGGGKQWDEIRPSASAIASPPPLRGSTYGNNKKATEGDDGPHPHLVLSSIIGGGSGSDSGGLSATAASSPEYLSLVGGSKEDTNEDGVVCLRFVLLHKHADVVCRLPPLRRVNYLAIVEMNCAIVIISFSLSWSFRPSPAPSFLSPVLSPGRRTISNSTRRQAYCKQ